MNSSLAESGRYLARTLTQTLRLMVGVPDYDTYVAHMKTTHPDREPMSYEAFFRERQQARYGTGRGRCCCSCVACPGATVAAIRVVTCPPRPSQSHPPSTRD